MLYLDIYTVTFNCAREKVKPEVFARNLFDGLPKSQAPDVLILSLQEVAPIAYSFLGGSYLIPYFQSFRHAVDLAATALNNKQYINIITRNVGMTAIMAFVLQDQTDRVKWLESAGVGVGMYEMGNKGAVGLRIGYSIGQDVMELAFVAAHLAPMEDAIDRRNEDWKNIVRGLVFTPVDPNAVRHTTKQLALPTNESEDEPLLPGSPHESTIAACGIYTPTSHLILAGDLNYRTSQTKPSLADYELYPQPNKDVTDITHYSHLLKEDQLSRELRAERTCHGLQEAAIKFPPTYKYSDRQREVAEADDGLRWDWAENRWPSWCDRILYLDLPSWMKAGKPSALIRVNEYIALPLMSTSDHRPVALSLCLPSKVISAPTSVVPEGGVRLHPPFSVDLHWREKRAAARRRELVVGMAAFLGLTWEGNGLLLATLFGALGGWAIIRSMLAG